MISGIKKKKSLVHYLRAKKNITALSPSCVWCEIPRLHHNSLQICIFLDHDLTSTLNRNQYPWCLLAAKKTKFLFKTYLQFGLISKNRETPVCAAVTSIWTETSTRETIPFPNSYCNVRWDCTVSPVLPLELHRQGFPFPLHTPQSPCAPPPNDPFFPRAGNSSVPALSRIQVNMATIAK